MSIEFSNSPYASARDIAAEYQHDAVAMPGYANKFLVISLFVSFHIQIFAGFPVPFFAPLVCGMALLALNVHHIPLKPAQLLASAWAIALVCAVLAPRSAFFGARLESTIYMMISMSLGLIVYIELSKWSPRLIARWAFAAAVTLIFGSVLEISVPAVRELTDAYRLWNFQSTIGDQFAMRDIGMYGIIRPTFFSKEPSFLAKHISLLLVIWLFVSPNPRRFFITLVLTTIAFFSVRSPTLILMFIVMFIYLMFDKRETLLEKVSTGAKIAAVLWVAPFIVAGIAILAFASFGTRIDTILAGQDASASIRITGSFAVVDDLLAFNPFTGVGVGGVDAFVADVLYPYFSQLPGDGFQEKYDTGALQLMNGPANYIAAFGILGGISLGFVLWRLQEYIAPRAAFVFWPIFVSFSLTIGALNGVRTWLIFFVILLAIRKSQETAAHKCGVSSGMT